MGNCNCDPCDPCKKSCCNDPCDIGTKGSSTIKYDGKDLPGLCIKRGMGLNEILAIIESSIVKLRQSQGELLSESSLSELDSNDDFSVQLNNIPFSVISVSYCGGIIPENGYIIDGSRVVLNNKAYCIEEGNEVIVTYIGMIKNKC